MWHTLCTILRNGGETSSGIDNKHAYATRPLGMECLLVMCVMKSSRFGQYLHVLIVFDGYKVPPPAACKRNQTQLQPTETLNTTLQRENWIQVHSWPGCHFRPGRNTDAALDDVTLLWQICCLEGDPTQQCVTKPNFIKVYPNMSDTSEEVLVEVAAYSDLLQYRLNSTDVPVRGMFLGSWRDRKRKTSAK